jgi:hypothetical protein
MKDQSDKEMPALFQGSAIVAVTNNCKAQLVDLDELLR